MQRGERGISRLRSKLLPKAVQLDALPQRIALDIVRSVLVVDMQNGGLARSGRHRALAELGRTRLRAAERCLQHAFACLCHPRHPISSCNSCTVSRPAAPTSLPPWQR